MVAEPTAYASLLRRLLPQVVKNGSTLAVSVLTALRGDAPALNGHPRLIDASAEDAHDA